MAERALATAFVNIVPGTIQLENYLKTQLGGQVEAAGVVAGNDMAKGVGTGFGAKIKGYIAPLAAGFAGTFAAMGVANFFKDSVSAASDFGESANAIKVAFGDSAGAIAALGEDSATRLGLSSIAFNEIATRFSGFAGTIAGESGDVAGVIDDLSTRGADFASVFNLDVNDALGLFQSGLAGETEPLRRFGIDLSAAAVENYALAEGIAEQGKQMTEQQKVQARYGLLMKETSKTQGDFANTSDGLANQQRILGAQMTELQKTVGGLLLPVLTGLATFANTVLIPAFQGIFGFISNNLPVIGTFVGVLGGLLIAFNAVSIATKGWAIAQGILNAVLAMNPLTLLAIAIAAVVAGIVYLATQTKFFQNAWKAMTGFVTSAWKTVTSFFDSSFKSIATWFKNLWSGAQNAFKSFVGWIGNAIKPIAGFFESAFKGIGSFFKGLINTWLGMFEKFINFFVKGINGIIGGLNKVLDGIAIATAGAIDINVSKIPSVSLPRLAKGGFVDQATTAIIGEAGPEVVTPLKDFERMMGLDKPAKSDRPIYADGIGLLGWVREVSNGQATLVFNKELAKVTRGTR
jgi:hypothetical protein